MKKIVVILMVGLGFTLASPGDVFSKEDKGKAKVELNFQQIISDDLKQRSMGSGSFDLFDASVNKVRNLRVMEFGDKIKQKKNEAVVPVKFRDVSTGDIVTVEAKLTESDGGWAVGEFEIKEVQEFKLTADMNKKFSDDEVRYAILEYVKSQMEFSEYLMLFDEKREKMRKLKLLNLDNEIRRFGVLSISMAKFEDVESRETLVIDVHVKNQKGFLEVTSLKIRKMISKESE